METAKAVYRRLVEQAANRAFQCDAECRDGERHRKTAEPGSAKRGPLRPTAGKLQYRVATATHDVL